MDATQTISASPPVFRELTCGVCGYLRTGLPPSAKCPECGAPPAKRIAPAIAMTGVAIDQAERAWLVCITAGLILLIVSSYYAIQSELYINNGGLTLLYLNAPAPKLTAGGCLLREMGPPGKWGVRGVIATLGTLLAIWLITEPRTARGDEKPLSLRRLTRYVALLSFGGLFGVLLSGYEIDIRFWGWYGLSSLLAAVGLVELPANTLLYVYLAQLSKRFDPAAQPRAQTSLVASVWLVAATCGSGVIISMLRAGTEDKPVELWRIVQAGYGALALASGMVMTLGTLRLTIRMAGATIDRSALSLAKMLPMIVEPIGTLIDRLRADLQRYFAAAGLILWMICTRPLMTMTALIQHRVGIGGDLPTLNFIGPKVWAVPLLDIERFGQVDTRLAILTTLVALWLITAYRPRPRRWPSPTYVRWLPTLLLGGAIGFALTIQKVADEFKQSYWNAGVVLLIEAPATLLTYLYLAKLARAIDQPKLARQLIVLSLAAAALIVWPVGYLAAGKLLRPLQANAVFLAAGILYGMAIVITGMMVWALFVKLAWLLLAPLFQRSADARTPASIAARYSGVGAAKSAF